MSKQSKRIGKSAQLLTDTASASAEVISARMVRLSDPREFLSARQQREVGEMVSEKMYAGAQGWAGAVAEAWLLPFRAASAFGKPSAFTPIGAMRAASEIGALWLGVGDAALRPAKTKASSNRTKLRKAKRLRR